MSNPSGHSGPPDAVYLDAASSEPLHPAAREALLAALDAGFADPLRLHRRGRDARMLLDNARAVVAACLGVRDDEVTFTSSGTAAVHVGLLGLLEGRARVSDRLVHSAVEHSAVIGAGRWWSRRSGSTTGVVGVDHHGRVSLDQVAAELSRPTGVLAVQAANHEVATLQPVTDVVDAAAAAGVPVFVDAAASTGRVDLPEGWAAAAASAHKWGGPAGVGVLLVRKGTRWRPPYPADDRTDPRASGFENVPAALAAAAALQARLAEREEVDARQHRLVARIRDRVAATVPDVEVVGDPERPAPPPGDLLLPLRRRGGDRHRAGPGRLRRGVGLGVHGVDADALARARGDGRAHPRQRPGVPDPGHHRGAGRPVPRRAARDRRGAASAGGAAMTGVDLEVDCRELRCPLPVVRLSQRIGSVPVGGVVGVVARDLAARSDVPAWCRIRGQEYLGEDTTPDGVPRYLVRRLR